jgi:hypothetical protein
MKVTNNQMQFELRVFLEVRLLILIIGKNYFTHSLLQQGGVIDFEMSA